MIVGLMSVYREGRLLEQAARSALAGCDAVMICEAPIGEPHDHGDRSPLFEIELQAAAVGREDLLAVHEREKPFASDAQKRTWMLQEAKRRWQDPDEPLWVLWLDGDELLLWPELLRDHCHRADLEQAGAGGFGLRIVELDGSVAMSYGKIIRAEQVRKYLESSYQVELHTGMVVALPNVPICGAGGIPVQVDPPPTSVEEQGVWLARCRPPLAGEPHLLHRSAMRHPDRAPQRMNEAEADWFPAALAAAGLDHVDTTPAPVLALPDKRIIIPGREERS